MGFGNPAEWVYRSEVTARNGEIHVATFHQFETQRDDGSGEVATDIQYRTPHSSFSITPDKISSTVTKGDMLEVICGSGEKYEIHRAKYSFDKAKADAYAQLRAMKGEVVKGVRVAA